MNNEEKILEILGRIEGDVSTLKGDVSTLKGDVSTLKNDVSILKDDMAGVKSRLDGHDLRLQRIENSVILIENEHGRKLDALFDGQEQLTRITGEIREDVKKLKAKSDIHDMEIVALKHTRAKKSV